jgi:branched-chain amino acid transport system substrate-binding protein
MADVAGGPKLKWVYDMYKAYYPELASKPGYPQTYMPYGIPSAMTVVNALKAAGPQPTREKFLTALSQTKFESNVMAGPIELTPVDHAGQKSAIYLKFDGTTMTPVPGAYRSLWTYQPK